MRTARVVTVWALFLLCSFAQEDAPTFKTQARSAFVWGEDGPSGAISSRLIDPLTGNEILKLRHAGIEISSRMGFEKLNREQSWEFIAYTSTIVNNTQERVSVKYGEITVDGRIVSPLSISDRHYRHRQNKKESVKIATLYCFSSGFLSQENFLTVDDQLSGLTVEPRSSLTVSSIFRDPRHYSILCSVDGCLPKGVIRYSIHVGAHDYIFVWPGRSLVECGR